MYFDSKPPEATDTSQFPSLDSVVTVENCWYYLALLEMFVDTTKDMTEKVLKLYLVRAEYRYFQWISMKSTIKRTIAYSIPPVDVAFFWQAHMLSPLRYYEDTLRVPFFCWKHEIPLKRIYDMNDFPNYAVHDEWKLVMEDEPYTLTKEALLENDTCASVTCIVCFARIESPWEEYAEWRTDHTVALQCHSCLSMFTVKHVGKANLFLDNEKNMLTAGLLLDDHAEFNKSAEEHELLRPLQKTKALSFNQGLKPLDNYIKEKQQHQEKKKKPTSAREATATRKRITDAIQSTYLCTPYRGSSIDLIQAVGRQYKFAHKATKVINWNLPQGVVKGIRHYSSFLALIKNNPGLTAVPTFEIDLAWHTHMLHHSNYRSFTQAYVGRLVNHDDNIPEATLYQHVQKTDQAWKKRNEERKSALLMSQQGEGFALFCDEKLTVMKSRVKFFFSSRNNEVEASRYASGFHKNDYVDEQVIFEGKYFPGNYELSPPYVPKLTSGDAEEANVKQDDKDDDHTDYDKEKISYHDKDDIKEFIVLKNPNTLINKEFSDVQKSIYGFIGTSNCANTDYLDQWYTSADAGYQVNTLPNKHKYTKVFLTAGKKPEHLSNLSTESKNQYSSFRESATIRYNSSGNTFNWHLISLAWRDVAANSAQYNFSCGVWASGGCSSASGRGNMGGTSNNGGPSASRPSNRDASGPSGCIAGEYPSCGGICSSGGS